MKYKKLMLRIACYITVVAMSLCIFTPVNADNNKAISNEDVVLSAGINLAVKDYLDAYLSNVYLYKDNDFSTFSVCKIDGIGLRDTFDINGETKTFESLIKNIDYLKDKALYWKSARQAQDIVRTDFLVNYYYSDIVTEDMWARVRVSALMQFRYVGCKAISIKEDVFDIDLVKFGTEWLVADVVELYDWFDHAYKNDTSFDVNQIIEECISGLDDAISVQSEVTLGNGLQAVDAAIPASARAGTTIAYNKTNATAYAYTYTTSTSGAVPTNYYNTNFQYFASDCMNFASQCVWAGFGGNNNVNSINANNAPMDPYRWFSSNTAYNNSGSWSNCTYFNSYIDDTSANSYAIEVRANKYELGKYHSFGVITNYANVLPGAVLHVPGADGDYGHAVVVTDVSSYLRSGVYYCAHTTMAKNVSVGDSWPEGLIRVIQPTAYYSASALTSPRITATMIRPIRVNSTITLAANADVVCDRMFITVISPNNIETNGPVTNSGTSATYNYTFSEAGLYKILVYALESVNGVEDAVVYYYTIRTYQ